MRDWTGANLKDVVKRTLDTFAPAQMKMSGIAVDVSPKHTLALSLALHELATNATKYGALSRPEGRVCVEWGAQDGLLRVNWEESGGPIVAPPVKKGFGSRLLEDLLVRDLGGATEFNFYASGLRCSITAAL